MSTESEASQPEPSAQARLNLQDVTAEMQALVLGGPARYSRTEVASAARMTLDEVRRLWRAMGFPDVGEYRAFTDADLAALLRVSSLIERGLLDLDSVEELTRSLGQTTARLAEWQVDTLGRRMLDQAEFGREDGLTANAVELAREQIDELLPEFESLLNYVWRRQIAATLARTFAEFDEIAEGGSATVGFADLVSFTRLSRQMDQDSLAMLVHTFETAAADVVHAAGGRLVKTLGDEVMFVCDSAVIAAEVGLRLHELSRSDLAVPQMRAGLATGSVLTRMGDVFGTTVNRASRLTASARPGTTLIDAATAEALGASGDDRFGTRALTPRPVRGLGLIRPYALTHGSRRLRDWRASGSATQEAPMEVVAGNDTGSS